MKRHILFFCVILSILLISLIYADENTSTENNPIYAAANSITNGTTDNSNTAETSGGLIIGRAICMNTDNFHGYYDVRTYELILNQSCQQGIYIFCRNLNSTEGWYNSNKELVLAGTCPNYKEKESIKNAIKENNRLKVINKTITSHCPQNCTCEGSTIKCTLSNGEREMTITAGKSGNIIVQIKGINASTNVTLYKAEDGKIYGVFKNNETKVVKMLPDQVKERIRERIEAKLDNENITLNEDGTYNYTAEQVSKLFGFIAIRTKVAAIIDSQTGDVKKITNGKWWSFLATKVKAPTVVGASCGTVTPGQNDACCQTKGYDVWNATSTECEFNASG